LDLGEIVADKNAPYLFVAYGVFLGALLVYFLSLGLRRRSMEQDEQIVDQIEKENAKSDQEATR
jgi:preprotein translocase subunit Sec63